MTNEKNVRFWIKSNPRYLKFSFYRTVPKNETKGILTLLHLKILLIF